MHVQATPLSSAASRPDNDEGVEVMGLAGATLMQLWSIGVARISDLTAYDTESLREKLVESQKGSAGSRERIEKTLADIHAALRTRNASLKPEPKATASVTVKREGEPQKQARGSEPPDHEWLDKANEQIPQQYKDPMEQFYRDMRRHNRLLSREEQNELGRRVQEEKDMVARDTLVLHNLRLVLWVARKQLWATLARRKEWSGLEYADLVQEGALGLMIAAEKYDPAQAAFTTYAFWWIRQAISRAIQDSGFIRIPVHLQELLYRVRRAANAIAIREGRPPTLNEIATAVEESPGKVKSAIKAGQMPSAIFSMDEPGLMQKASGEDDDQYELIADEMVLRADRVLEAKEELDGACKRLNDLTEALYGDETISERNREIFVRFYGLDGALIHRTLEHTAENYEMTRERVRQIIQQCWEKLQLAGTDMDHDSVLEDLKRIQALEKLTHKRVSTS